jgi:transposase
MIMLTPQTRILVAIAPADFRAGIDSLCAVCREQFSCEPFDGTLYVFRNRAGTAIKMLAYDGGGFWLLHKRFSNGKLRYWPTNATEPLSPMAAKELQILIYNGDPSTAQFAEDWRKVPV